MNSIIVDIETTGLSPLKNRIIEIYALKLDEQLEEKENFYALIKIDEPLPVFISNLTGITDKMLEEKGESEKTVMRNFHQFIAHDLLVGHNINKFDLPFLQAACGRWHLTITNKTFDTLKVARKTFKFDKYNLKELAGYLHIESETFHNARDDVLVTAELFKKLVNVYS